MARRNRLLDLMTQSSVAQSELERARIAAQRDAALQAGALQALSQALPAAIDAGGKLYGQAGAAALEQGSAFAKQHTGELGAPTGQAGPLGPLLESPADVAKRVVASEPSLAPMPTENVNPLEWIGAKLQNPLREKAAAQAAAQIAESVKANQQAQQQLAREEQRTRQEREFVRGRDVESQAFQAEQGDLTRQQQVTLAKQHAEVVRAQAAAERAARAEDAKQNRDLRREEIAANERIAKGRAEALTSAAQARAARAAGPKPLDTATATALADFDSTDKLADEISLNPAAKSGQYPGSQLINSAAQTIGVDDPHYTQLRTDLGALAQAYQKAMTGLGASDKEAAAIVATMPGPGDAGPAFATKMDAFKRRIKIKRDALLETFGKAGRDVSQFRSAPESGQSAPDQAQYLDELTLDGG